MNADIVIIGCGAAGLMAATGAAKTGAGVLVIEKMPRPGRKIMISGKGRCNITNLKDWNSFSQHIHPKANFLKPAFYNLPPEDNFYIMTGGGPGIMEAANKGAFLAGGKTAGLTITIPDEQRRNAYVTPELGINFHYFLMRKFWLLFFAKAIVVFPGGTGTFDEFFEVFTLMKTRKTQEIFPIVLFGKTFWKKVVDFQALIDADVISENDLNFFIYVETVDEAFKYITSSLKKRLPEVFKKTY